GNGVNCEIETAHACRLAGFECVDIVSIWELLAGERRLDGYDLLVLPGGFLDGDDLGSAKAQANRLLRCRDPQSGLPIVEQLMSFVREGKLVLGICNGFQLAIKLGILPALEGAYMTQQATLTHNDSGKFEDRWTYLKVNTASPCIFTKGMERTYLPVRHGEGKFVCADKDNLKKLRDNQQVVLSYVDPLSGNPTISYPDNPNGSQHGVAGLCDPTGRVFGLMPHPEAFLHRTNHPRWTREDLPEEGDGLLFFRNAYEYVKECL
ncbi:MAG: phosphoribosylformylglycinamidine synthase subunit PurQ, partial [Chitinivibrionales bacterium]|nr:phosphoribosylformylglycinamidine synthase subunit PurQ [Chitinivibrionales bacterium]MBD3357987.1 phosphoribosylformylglycinamidine synthase subunit PurQ [Chitinivibrionales bacterium]